MDLGIAGKTALVFGAGGGLGSAIAVALAQEGCNVAISSRNQDALDTTMEKIQATGSKAIAQEALEDWIMSEVKNGVALPGLYPPNEDSMQRYKLQKSR